VIIVFRILGTKEPSDKRVSSSEGVVVAVVVATSGVGSRTDQSNGYRLLLLFHESMIDLRSPNYLLPPLSEISSRIFLVLAMATYLDTCCCSYCR
jgi:hypothetical protein